MLIKYLYEIFFLKKPSLLTQRCREKEKDQGADAQPGQSRGRLQSHQKDEKIIVLCLVCLFMKTSLMNCYGFVQEKRGKQILCIKNFCARVQKRMILQEMNETVRITLFLLSV